MSGRAQDSTVTDGWLRRRRERLLLTQEELAARSGVDARTIREIEAGRTTHPRASTVRLLLQALADMERAAPPGKPDEMTVRGRPAQLPADVARFIGRDSELHELDDLVETGGESAMIISAIAGTAGVGKTALAVHWAHRVNDRFPDGQLYVNLHGYDVEKPVSPGQALAGFLRGLGVAGQDIPPSLAERAARYRSETAHRRMIIVLDNASDVEQVRPLLPGGSGCVVLVTSRDSLAGLVAVHGAQRLELDLLSRDEAVALLRALIGSRIDADTEATALLVEQCARLPLALRVAAELAASRPSWSVGELTAELADERRRLDSLDAGGDPRAAVTAVFSWSYKHLAANAAQLFRLLSLHPGRDLDVYAAAALADMTLVEVRRTLDTLTRAHLVQIIGPHRYGMHDLLRAYAAGLAAAADSQQHRTAATGRLADYYLATAAAAIDLLYPADAYLRPKIESPGTPVPQFADPAAALTWLDAECAVLTLLAGTWTTERHKHVVALSAILYRYLNDGHHADAATIHQAARAAAAAMRDPVSEAQAMVNLAVSLALGGRSSTAIDLLGQALATYREINEPMHEARTLHNLGCAETRIGHHNAGIAYLEESAALFRQTGNPVGEAKVLSDLGYSLTRAGRYTAAAAQLAQAVDLTRQNGDALATSRALTNLGLVEQQLKQYHAAAQHHRQAVTISHTNGDRAGEAHALAGLADTDLHIGRADRATERFGRALAYLRQAGDHDGQAWAINGLGEAARATGDHHTALARHTEALTIATRIGNGPQQARAHDGIADCLQVGGLVDDAREHRRRALQIYAALGTPRAE